MEMFYVYFPIKSEMDGLDAIDYIEKELGAKVVENDRMPSGNYHNFKTKFLKKSPWLNLLLNVDFASDPRKFIRFRLDGCHKELIELLSKKAIEDHGFYGMSSKEFKDSSGNTVFNVKDGKNHIALSGGEVCSRLAAVSSELGESMTNDEYIEHFELHFGVVLEYLGNNQYKMPIPFQKTA